MVSAVIFDVDGTLVDSVDEHAEAWRRAFLEYGQDVPFAHVRSQIGKGADQLIPVFFNDEEKAANSKLCTCVSRVAGGSITIDTADRAA